MAGTVRNHTLDTSALKLEVGLPAVSCWLSPRSKVFVPESIVWFVSSTLSHCVLDDRYSLGGSRGPRSHKY